MEFQGQTTEVAGENIRFSLSSLYSFFIYYSYCFVGLICPSFVLFYVNSSLKFRRGEYKMVEYSIV